MKPILALAAIVTFFAACKKNTPQPTATQPGTFTVKYMLTDSMHSFTLPIDSYYHYPGQLNREISLERDKEGMYIVYGTDTFKRTTQDDTNRFHKNNASLFGHTYAMCAISADTQSIGMEYITYTGNYFISYEYSGYCIH